jgi:hypothetical protein
LSIAAKVKANPMTSILTTVVLISATITGTLTATGQFDALVMTELEHNLDIAPMKMQIMVASDAVEGIQVWNQCARLEQRIAELEDRKWKREQAGATADAIRDIENDIAAERQRFNALNCAQILAG